MLLSIKKLGRVDFTLCLGIEPSSRVHIVALLSTMEAACTGQCTNKEVTDLHLKYDHKRVRQGNPWWETIDGIGKKSPPWETELMNNIQEYRLQSPKIGTIEFPISLSGNWTQLSRVFVHLAGFRMMDACADQYTNKEVGYMSLRRPLSWGRVETKIDEASLTLFQWHRAVVCWEF